jgi:hypothetical protein
MEAIKEFLRKLGLLKPQEQEQVQEPVVEEEQTNQETTEEPVV